jgi:SAM-dependent methyltransferase
MSASSTIGWDHPETARYYDAFDRRHGRYRRANRILAGHAALARGLRVLDVAAGTGGTARAALKRLGPGGTVVCFEPAAAMRSLGERSLLDPRVSWRDRWPVEPGSFDRILCGAAIWQLHPLDETFRRCFDLLRPGGGLAFDLPSLYLGEPDEPGGGRDPYLMELPASLAAGRSNTAESFPPLPDAAGIERLLASAGFRADRWGFALPFRQTAYRDWLKIPPTTDGILAGLDARERARAIDGAFRRVDPKAWRRERWTGWTAWKGAS